MRLMAFGLNFERHRPEVVELPHSVSFVKGKFIPDEDLSKMKRGETEVETLRLNGWGVGDILEGDEGRGPERIVITSIGAEHFDCKWQGRTNYSNRTTLVNREWKKVGNIFENFSDMAFTISKVN